MGETHVVGDPHLYHYNIALHDRRERWIIPNPDYDPSKPFHFKFNNHEAVDLKRHDDEICQWWNEDVSKKDTVILLGDVAWKYHASFIMRLNGKKFLVRGNHDKMPDEALRLFAKIEGSHFQYSWFTKIYGRQVMFSHCPYLTWFSSCHGSWNLHAHCHGRSPDVPHILQMDCGIPVWGYRPLHWSVIEKVMTEKEKNRKEWMREREKEHGRCEGDEAPMNSVILRNKNLEILKSMGRYHV